MATSLTTQYQIEDLKQCPQCGDTEFVYFSSSMDQLLHCDERIFQYVKCKSCSLVFQKVRPTENTISYFYRQDYAPYQNNKESNGSKNRFHKLAHRLGVRLTGLKRANRLIEKIHAHQLINGGVFLDFGCGYGSLLDQYEKKYGCRSIGMDFNPDVVSELKSRGRHALIADSMGWSQIEDQSVDFVIMNHVLEHLYQPREVLRQVKRVLKPSGLLDMATPNPSGLSSKRFGVNWFALDAPRHVMLYEPKTVIALLQEAGFTTLNIVGKPVLKDYFRSLARSRGREVEAVGIVKSFQIAIEIRSRNKLKEYDQYHVFACPGSCKLNL